MDTNQLDEFRTLLHDEKQRLIEKAMRTRNNEIELSKEEMADEVDLASVLAEQSFSLRLRDRERKLIQKIDTALERIDNDEFGECTVCGEDIALKRLRARPVTTMCIECKKDEERREKHFSD